MRVGEDEPVTASPPAGALKRKSATRHSGARSEVEAAPPVLAQDTRRAVRSAASVVAGRQVLERERRRDLGKHLLHGPSSPSQRNRVRSTGAQPSRAPRRARSASTSIVSRKVATICSMSTPAVLGWMRWNSIPCCAGRAGRCPRRAARARRDRGSSPERTSGARRSRPSRCGAVSAVIRLGRLKDGRRARLGGARGASVVSYSAAYGCIHGWTRGRGWRRRGGGIADRRDRHGGALPRRAKTSTRSGRTSATASSPSASSPTRSCSPRASRPSTLRDPAYVKACAGARRTSTSSTRRSSASARATPRCSIRSTACSSRRPGRRFENAGYVGERVDGPVGVFAACGLSEYMIKNLVTNQEVMDVGRRVAGAPHRQRHELPRHARLLRARPQRPEHERADGVLVVAGRGPPRLPEPARRRVRPRARRRLHHLAPRRTAATSTRRARSSRPTATAAPSTRGRRARSSAAAAGCVRPQAARRRRRRRRHDPRGHPRLGDQQRRLGEGRLPRAQRRGAGARRRRGAGRRRRERRRRSRTSRRTAPAR